MRGEGCTIACYMPSVYSPRTIIAPATDLTPDPALTNPKRQGLYPGAPPPLAWGPHPRAVPSEPPSGGRGP